MNTVIYAIVIGLIIGVALCVFDHKNIRAHRKPWLIRLFAFVYGLVLSAFFVGGEQIVSLAPSAILGILGWFFLIVWTFAVALLGAIFGFAVLDFPARDANHVAI